RQCPAARHRRESGETPAPALQPANVASRAYAVSVRDGLLSSCCGARSLCGRETWMQLASSSSVSHVARMANDQFYARNSRFRGTFRAGFGAAGARGPIIDQEGRVIPQDELKNSFESRFDFRRSMANPFAQLSRDQ